MKFNSGDKVIDDAGFTGVVTATGDICDMMEHDNCGMVQDGINEGYIDKDEPGIAVTLNENNETFLYTASGFRLVKPETKPIAPFWTVSSTFYTSFK
jgi:hypothetical protein